MRTLTKFSILVVLTILMLVIRLTDNSLNSVLSDASFNNLNRLIPRPANQTETVLVLIDDQDLETYGQWPWPRSLLADLTDTLAGKGAAAIAFAITFSEEDRMSSDGFVDRLDLDNQTKDKIRDLLAESASMSTDTRFSESLQFSNSILGYVLKPSSNTTNTANTPPVESSSLQSGALSLKISSGVNNPLEIGNPPMQPFLTALPQLQNSAVAQGYLNLQKGHDGELRFLKIFEPVSAPTGDDDAEDTDILVSFPVALLAAGQGVAGLTVTSANSYNLGDFTIPTDAKQRIRLYDQAERFRHVFSVSDLLQGGVDPDFTNTLIIVGSSVIGLSGSFATPLHSNVSSAEIHAQLTDQILYNALPRLHPQSLNLSLVLFLVLTAFLFLICIKSLSLVRPFVLLVVPLLVATLALTVWAFAEKMYLLDVGWAISAIALLWLTMLGIEFEEQRRARRSIRQAFSQYLAPELVQQLERDPTALKLGGEERIITVLFMDLAGFTQLAERLDAPTTTGILNMVFTELTQCIMNHGGTVDKYMGDGMMAFWNAPLKHNDHALQATSAAKEILGTAAELTQRANTAFGLKYTSKESTGEEDTGAPVVIDIRLGLHTGPCYVGNMGSEQRFNYTAIGDVVNVAARLESKTRETGEKCILSKTVIDASGANDRSQFNLHPIGDLTLKGRTQPMQAFALR